MITSLDRKLERIARDIAAAKLQEEARRAPRNGLSGPHLECPEPGSTEKISFLPNAGAAECILMMQPGDSIMIDGLTLTMGDFGPHLIYLVEKTAVVSEYTGSYLRKKGDLNWRTCFSRKELAELLRTGNYWIGQVAQYEERGC